jgi:hypothetical protein
MTIGVDVRYLPDPAGVWRRPMRDIADDLAARGMPILPVLRLCSKICSQPNNR